MRVATAPGVNGERITIRLLDRASVLHDLADIGFGDDHLDADRTSSSTGRTASCWSPARPARARPPRCTPAWPRSTRPISTSSPSRIRSSTSSRASRRSPVNAKIDLTFAIGAAHRSCATIPTSSWSAKFATARPPKSRSRRRSPATWCFSTIHTNDAAGAITRLVDMGDRAVPRRLVAGGAAGAAPGAPPVPRVPRALRPDRGRAAQARHRSRRPSSTAALRVPPMRSKYHAAARACSTARATAAARAARMPATRAESASTSCC